MHHVFRLTYTDFFFSAKEAFSALHLPSKVTPMVSYYETLLHNGTHSLTHNLLSEATADVNSDSWSEFSRLHLSNTLTTSHTAPQYNFLPFTCPSSWQLISHSLCTNTPWLFFICNPQKQLPCGCFLASLKPSTVVMLPHWFFWTYRLHTSMVLPSQRLDQSRQMSVCLPEPQCIECL